MCFLEDVHIVTNNQMLSSRYVSEDDRLVTHMGRFRRVSDVLSRPYTGEIVEFDTCVAKRHLAATVDQIILTADPKTGNTAEKKIGELTTSDWVFYPRDVNYNSERTLRLDTLFKSPYFHKYEVSINRHGKLRVVEPTQVRNNDDDFVPVKIAVYGSENYSNEIVMSDDYARLLGYFSEAVWSGNEDGSVHLVHFMAKQKMCASDFVYLLKKVFKVQASVTSRSGGFDVETDSELLMMIFTGSIATAMDSWRTTDFFPKFNQSNKMSYVKAVLSMQSNVQKYVGEYERPKILRLARFILDLGHVPTLKLGLQKDFLHLKEPIMIEKQDDGSPDFHVTPDRVYFRVTGVRSKFVTRRWVYNFVVVEDGSFVANFVTMKANSGTIEA